jgi:hypothetical protein
MDDFNESFESDPDFLPFPTHPESNKTDNPKINIEINRLFIVCGFKIIANLNIIKDMTEEKNINPIADCFYL